MKPPSIFKSGGRPWLRAYGNVYVSAEAPFLAGCALLFSGVLVATGMTFAGIVALLAFALIGRLTDFGWLEISYQDDADHG